MLTLVQLSPWEIIFFFLMHFLVICSIFLLSAEISEDLGYVKSVLESKIKMGEGSIANTF